MAYLMPRGDTRSTTSSSQVDTSWSRSDHPPTWSPSNGHWLTEDRAIRCTQTCLDLHLMADLHRGTITIFVDRTAGGGLSSRSLSDGLEGARKNSPITVHWNRDGGAIVDPSSWNPFHDLQTAFKVDRYHDQTTIVAWSWRDRGAIVASFEANLRKNSPQIWEERSRPKESLPWPHQTAPTTASIAHDLEANFPFKNPCILLLFFNFWSIREGS